MALLFRRRGLAGIGVGGSWFHLPAALAYCRALSRFPREAYLLVRLVRFREL